LIKTIVAVILACVLAVFVVGCALYTSIPAYENSAQYQEGKFINMPDALTSERASYSELIWRYMSEDKIDSVPDKPIPLQQIDVANLLMSTTSEPVTYRLGHSSLLLIINGKIWLVDPVFSERASPFSWMGPKRFHDVPFNISELPKIDGVIISHDHYDHLDEQTLKSLKEKIAQFIVPLGVGQRLKEWGISSHKISELDWWQETKVGDIAITATPAQHFSGRGLFDRNSTLWASWVIKTPTHRLFYSGDSGYFDGFKEIGEKLGPFDLTILESGAYDRDWPTVHLMPNEAIQAHIDLRGRALMPVHNSTFDLAFHAWYEPFEKLSLLAEEQNVILLTPVIGQALRLNKVVGTERWWKLR
jgi:L-ascorbate metabolism protein UlaG (beta-lactamase superfamily)